MPRRLAGWLCLIVLGTMALGCAPGRVQMIPETTPEPAATVAVSPNLTPTPVPPAATPTPMPTTAPMVRRSQPARVEPKESAYPPVAAVSSEPPAEPPAVLAAATAVPAAAEENPVLYWTPTPIAAAALPTASQSSGARFTAGWVVLGLVGLGLIVLLIGWLRRGDRREPAAAVTSAPRREESLRSGVHPETRAVHPAPEPAPVHPHPEPAPRREAEPAKVIHPVIPHAAVVHAEAPAEPLKKAALRARRPPVKTVKLKRASAKAATKPEAKKRTSTARKRA